MAAPTFQVGNLEEAFSALLNPIKIQDWNINLCEILETYLVHMQITIKPNFTQAAVILQNSAYIYCKKVDHLWTIIFELIESLRSGESSKDDQQNNGKKKKPRKAQLATEEMNSFSEVNAASSLHVNYEKRKKGSAKINERIVLNPTIKVKTAENTSCDVYFGKDRAVLGRKEEFRLNWTVSSEGRLREDFVNKNVLSNRRSLLEGLDETFLSDDGDVAITCGHSPHHMTDDVDIQPQRTVNDSFKEEMETRTEQKPQLEEPQRIERLVDVANAIVTSEELKANNIWGPVLFTKELPMAAIRQKRVFKLPKDIMEVNKKAKRRRSEENTSQIDWLPIVTETIGGTTNECNSFQSNFFAALEQCEIDKRKLRRRRAYNDLVLQEACRDDAGDFPGYDIDAEGGVFEGYHSNDNEHDMSGDNVDAGVDDQPGNIQEALDHFLPVDENCVETYENDAQRKLQEFNQLRKDNQNRMTDLASRVSGWHEAVALKLEASEKRSKFDIHEYGSRILNKFPCTNAKTTLPFKEIVRGQQKEEVCRYFLSALCLANTYNVEISQSQLDDTALSELPQDCMHLTLLSRVRHHEELDDNMRANANS